AHYELAAGRPQAAEDLLRVMELSTEGGRLIPEQVWDRADIPALELFLGKPSGSACPLVWAHSEYIKLRRSLRDGKIFDQPSQTVQRYVIEKQSARHFEWRFNNKCRTMPRARNSVFCCPRRRWCIGASMDGAQRRIQIRAIHSAYVSLTCRRINSKLANISRSPSIGKTSSDGKEPIFL